MIPNKTKKFLHVGCGMKNISQTPFMNTSWEEVRFDIDEKVDPDVIGSITNMNMIKNDSFDAIYSSHNIEHLYHHEVLIALKEFKKKLKPNGFILITCPDLISVCSLVVENKLLDPIYESGKGPIAPIDIIYGHRESLRLGNHYMSHKSGFTENSLLTNLKYSGYCQVVSKTRSSEFDIWALATVQELPVEDIKKLAVKYFP